VIRTRWLGAVLAATFTVAACGGAAPTTAPTTAATAAPTIAPVETPEPLPTRGTVLKTGLVVGDEIPLSAGQEALIRAHSAGKLVGIVATTMETEYHRTLNEAAQARAEALGYTAEICDSQVDTAKALQCLEGFVSKGAVAIITTSTAETVGAAAGEAIAAGIIIVQVTGTDLVDTGAITVAVDNVSIGLAAGRGAGEFAATQWPGETAEAIILDFPDFASLIARADAIEREMLAANENISVVGRFKGGLADLGVTACETALQRFPNLRVVTGINDGGNLGCYQALVAAGKKAGDIGIFGIDCDPQAVALIDQGTMYEGCVNTNPAGTGELAVNVFNRLLAGDDVPARVEVPVFVYTGP
jgi:ABC-type sugar transport system substrate-binding protein